MSFKERLNRYVQKKQMQVQKGKEISEQMKAEKLRKKINGMKNAKPGAITTIKRGLATKSNPIDVMKEEYHRRKYERDNK